MDAKIGGFIRGYLDKIYTSISTTYDIPVSALLALEKQACECDKSDIEVKPKKVTKPKVVKEKKELKESEDGQYSEDYLKKCTKDELVRLCKLKKQKTTGNKDDLVKRLISSNKPPIIQKMFKCSPIHVIKNEWGNRMHPQSRLVFSEDKIVVGYQNDDGSVSDLTPDMIDMCNQYKFKYKLPMNLDTSLRTEEIDQKISDLVEEEKNADVDD